MIRKILTVCSVLLAGCAGPASVRYADRTITAEQVRESVRQRQAKVVTMQGSGNISVETPEMAQSGSFTLALHRPDSLLVKLEGPFGLEVGAALVTRRQFLFYNGLQNRLIVGPTNAANLKKILRIQVEFDDLLNLFTGGLFVSEDNRSPDSFTIEDEHFVLAFDNPQGSRRYWVDPQSHVIVRIQHLDRRGRLVFEQRYANFRAIGEAIIPHHMFLTQHLERRSVAIALFDLSINPSFTTCSLQIPSNAQRVEW
jgi:outer membrane lipoprotein-sorting protein